MESDKRGEKKPAHPRRLVQETGTKCVPNNLTNQYLWDLDCGLHDDSSPARKRKGMKGNATRCVNCRLLLQIDDRPKKTCASAQAGARDEYDSVLRILTNQYLWDLDCGC